MFGKKKINMVDYHDIDKLNMNETSLPKALQFPIPEGSEKIAMPGNSTLLVKPFKLDETMPTTPNGTNNSNKLGTPAIVFKTSVYAADDAFTIDSKVCDTFTKIAVRSVENSVNRIHDNLSNDCRQLSEELNTFETCHMYDALCSGIDSLIYNFDATLNNCLLYHLSIMNIGFSVEAVDFLPSVNFLDPSDCYFTTDIFNNHTFSIRSCLGDIYRMDRKFLQEAFNKGYVDDTMITYVTGFGEDIYYYIRKKLNPIIINASDHNKHVVEGIFSDIAHEFSKMMLDFNYEASVFVSNLENLLYGMPDYTEANNIAIPECDHQPF